MPWIRKLYDDQLKRLASSQDQAIGEIDVPLDPQAFYTDFGLLTHPKTGEPVPRLTAYQADVWRAGFAHNYRLVVKSQKIGLTTSVLLEDFQRALTTCRGFELLVVAQSIQHAREHLYTLRGLILDSQKYSRYLLLRPTDYTLDDQVTKVTVLYIRNPDNPRRPTRIIGLGANEASIWSWKRVKHIHVSDIAATQKLDYSGVISALHTRLATTEGTMIIETPPRGPTGRVYEIWRQSQLQKEEAYDKNKVEPAPGQWWVTKIPAREAVQAGVISEQFLEEERAHLGHLYPAYYEAEFMIGFGNLFLPEAIDKLEELGAAHRSGIGPDDFNPNTPKALGIDYGGGSSDMAFVLLEYNNGLIRTLAEKSFSRESRFPDMVNFAHELWSHYDLRRVGKIYVDASAPEFIREVKLAIGENADYEPLVLEYRRNKVDLNKTSMQVIPVPFQIYNDQMTAFAKSVVDAGLVAIHPDKFPGLLLDLKNAKTDEKGKLEKDATNKMDLFDAFRMALRFFKFSPEQLKRNDTQSLA